MWKLRTEEVLSTAVLKQCGNHLNSSFHSFQQGKSEHWNSSPASLYIPEITTSTHIRAETCICIEQHIWEALELSLLYLSSPAAFSLIFPLNSQKTLALLFVTFFSEVLGTFLFFDLSLKFLHSLYQLPSISTPFLGSILLP